MLRRIALVLVLLAAPVLAKTDWVAYYWKKVDEFKEENKKLDPKATHVVLLGDSLTEGWTAGRVKRFLPTIAGRVLNRGISSDGIGRGKERGVIRRLDSSVFDCNPTHVFLLAGVNDLGSTKEQIAATAATYKKCVEAIREKLPKVVVVVITEPPCGKSRKELAANVLIYNEHLRAIAKDLKLPIIDFHPLLADKDGFLPDDMSKDGLHFNDKGYEKLGPEIEKICASK